MYEASDTMEDSSTYSKGDIVWVKLSSYWWPGEVISEDDLPSDLSDFKKPPLVIVKFFDEDSYEYVKNSSNVHPYNSPKKAEFIKKGMAGFRAKLSHMAKFPKDIGTAEERTNGNPNILSQQEFLPVKKINYDDIFGTPSPKKVTKGKGSSSTKKTQAKDNNQPHITHRRFLGNDDYRAYICIQYPGKDRKWDSDDEEIKKLNEEPEKILTCHSCAFKTKRLEVMILHTKMHIQGIYITSKRKAKKPKGQDESDSESETVATKSPKPKQRKKKDVKPEMADVFTNLLEEWDDTDEEMEGETPSIKKSQKPKKKLVEVTKLASDDEKEEIQDDKDDQESKSTTEEASSTSESTDVRKPRSSLKNTQDDIKNCFDFDEEEEDDDILLPTSVGRKIPRVIPEKPKPSISELLEQSQKEDELEKEMVSDPVGETEKQPEAPIATENGTDINKKEILRMSQSFNRAPDVDDNIENSFKELMAETELPTLDDLAQNLKPEQNFHDARTVKFPDKGGTTLKGGTTSKTGTSKKKFITSFEDFEAGFRKLEDDEKRTKKMDSDKEAQPTKVDEDKDEIPVKPTDEPKENKETDRKSVEIPSETRLGETSSSTEKHTSKRSQQTKPSEALEEATLTEAVELQTDAILTPSVEQKSTSQSHTADDIGRRKTRQSEKEKSLEPVVDQQTDAKENQNDSSTVQEDAVQSKRTSRRRTKQFVIEEDSEEIIEITQEYDSDNVVNSSEQVVDRLDEKSKEKLAAIDLEIEALERSLESTESKIEEIDQSENVAESSVEEIVEVESCGVADSAAALEEIVKSAVEQTKSTRRSQRMTRHSLGNENLQKVDEKVDHPEKQAASPEEAPEKGKRRTSQRRHEKEEPQIVVIEDKTVPSSEISSDETQQVEKYDPAPATPEKSTSKERRGRSRGRQKDVEVDLKKEDETESHLVEKLEDTVQNTPRNETYSKTDEPTLETVLVETQAQEVTVETMEVISDPNIENQQTSEPAETVLESSNQVIQDQLEESDKVLQEPISPESTPHGKRSRTRKHTKHLDKTTLEAEAPIDMSSVPKPTVSAEVTTQESTIQLPSELEAKPPKQSSIAVKIPDISPESVPKLPEETIVRARRSRTRWDIKERTQDKSVPVLTEVTTQESTIQLPEDQTAVPECASSSSVSENLELEATRTRRGRSQKNAKEEVVLATVKETMKEVLANIPETGIVKQPADTVVVLEKSTVEVISDQNVTNQQTSEPAETVIESSKELTQDQLEESDKVLQEPIAPETTPHSKRSRTRKHTKEEHLDKTTLEAEAPKDMSSVPKPTVSAEVTTQESTIQLPSELEAKPPKQSSIAVKIPDISPESVPKLPEETIVRARRSRTRWDIKERTQDKSVPVLTEVTTQESTIQLPEDQTAVPECASSSSVSENLELPAPMTRRGRSQKNAKEEVVLAAVKETMEEVLANIPEIGIVEQPADTVVELEVATVEVTSDQNAENQQISELAETVLESSKEVTQDQLEENDKILQEPLAPESTPHSKRGRTRKHTKEEHLDKTTLEAEALKDMSSVPKPSVSSEVMTLESTIQLPENQTDVPESAPSRSISENLDLQTPRTRRGRSQKNAKEEVVLADVKETIEEVLANIPETGIVQEPADTVVVLEEPTPKTRRTRTRNLSKEEEQHATAVGGHTTGNIELEAKPPKQSSIAVKIPDISPEFVPKQPEKTTVRSRRSRTQSQGLTVDTIEVISDQNVENQQTSEPAETVIESSKELTQDQLEESAKVLQEPLAPESTPRSKRSRTRKHTKEEHLDKTTLEAEAPEDMSSIPKPTVSAEVTTQESTIQLPSELEAKPPKQSSIAVKIPDISPVSVPKLPEETIVRARRRRTRWDIKERTQDNSVPQESEHESISASEPRMQSSIAVKIPDISPESVSKLPEETTVRSRRSRTQSQVVTIETIEVISDQNIENQQTSEPAETVVESSKEVTQDQLDDSNKVLQEPIAPETTHRSKKSKTRKHTKKEHLDKTTLEAEAPEDVSSIPKPTVSAEVTTQESTIQLPSELEAKPPKQSSIAVKIPDISPESVPKLPEETIVRARRSRTRWDIKERTQDKSVPQESEHESISASQESTIQLPSELEAKPPKQSSIAVKIPDISPESIPKLPEETIVRARRSRTRWDIKERTQDKSVPQESEHESISASEPATDLSDVDLPNKNNNMDVEQIASEVKDSCNENLILVPTQEVSSADIMDSQDSNLLDESQNTESVPSKSDIEASVAKPRSRTQKLIKEDVSSVIQEHITQDLATEPLELKEITSNSASLDSFNQPTESQNMESEKPLVEPAVEQYPSKTRSRHRKLTEKETEIATASQEAKIGDVTVNEGKALELEVITSNSASSDSVAQPIESQNTESEKPLVQPAVEQYPSKTRSRHRKLTEKETEIATASQEAKIEDVTVNEGKALELEGITSNSASSVSVAQPIESQNTESEKPLVQPAVEQYPSKTRSRHRKLTDKETEISTASQEAKIGGVTVNEEKAIANFSIPEVEPPTDKTQNVETSVPDCDVEMSNEPQSKTRRGRSRKYNREFEHTEVIANLTESVECPAENQIVEVETSVPEPVEKVIDYPTPRSRKSRGRKHSKGEAVSTLQEKNASEVRSDPLVMHEEPYSRTRRGRSRRLTKEEEDFARAIEESLKDMALERNHVEDTVGQTDSTTEINKSVADFAVPVASEPADSHYTPKMRRTRKHSKNKEHIESVTSEISSKGAISEGNQTQADLALPGKSVSEPVGSDSFPEVPVGKRRKSRSHASNKAVLEGNLSKDLGAHKTADHELIEHTVEMENTALKSVSDQPSHEMPEDSNVKWDKNRKDFTEEPQTDNVVEISEQPTPKSKRSRSRKQVQEEMQIPTIVEGTSKATSDKQAKELTAALEFTKTVLELVENQQTVMRTDIAVETVIQRNDVPIEISSHKTQFEIGEEPVKSRRGRSQKHAIIEEILSKDNMEEIGHSLMQYTALNKTVPSVDTSDSSSFRSPKDETLARLTEHKEQPSVENQRIRLEPGTSNFDKTTDDSTFKKKRNKRRKLIVEENAESTVKESDSLILEPELKLASVEIQPVETSISDQKRPKDEIASANIEPVGPEMGSMGSIIDKAIEQSVDSLVTIPKSNLSEWFGGLLEAAISREEKSEASKKGELVKDDVNNQGRETMEANQTELGVAVSVDEMPVESVKKYKSRRSKQEASLLLEISQLNAADIQDNKSTTAMGGQLETETLTQADNSEGIRAEASNDIKQPKSYIPVETTLITKTEQLASRSKRRRSRKSFSGESSLIPESPKMDPISAPHSKGEVEGREQDAAFEKTKDSQSEEDGTKPSSKGIEQAVEKVLLDTKLITAEEPAIECQKLSDGDNNVNPSVINDDVQATLEAVVQSCIDSEQLREQVTPAYQMAQTDAKVSAQLLEHVPEVKLTTLVSGTTSSAKPQEVQNFVVSSDQVIDGHEVGKDTDKSSSSTVTSIKIKGKKRTFSVSAQDSEFGQKDSEVDELVQEMVKKVIEDECKNIVSAEEQKIVEAKEPTQEESFRNNSSRLPLNNAELISEIASEVNSTELSKSSDNSAIPQIEIPDQVSVDTSKTVSLPVTDAETSFIVSKEELADQPVKEETVELVKEAETSNDEAKVVDMPLARTQDEAVSDHGTTVSAEYKKRHVPPKKSRWSRRGSYAKKEDDAHDANLLKEPIVEDVPEAVISEEVVVEDQIVEVNETVIETSTIVNETESLTEVKDHKSTVSIEPSPSGNVSGFAENSFVDLNDSEIILPPKKSKRANEIKFNFLNDSFGSDSLSLEKRNDSDSLSFPSCDDSIMSTSLRNNIEGLIKDIDNFDNNYSSDIIIKTQEDDEKGAATSDEPKTEEVKTEINLFSLSEPRECIREPALSKCVPPKKKKIDFPQQDFISSSTNSLLQNDNLKNEGKLGDAILQPPKKKLQKLFESSQALEKSGKGNDLPQMSPLAKKKSFLFHPEDFAHSRNTIEICHQADVTVTAPKGTDSGKVLSEVALDSTNLKTEELPVSSQDSNVAESDVSKSATLPKKRKKRKSSYQSDHSHKERRISFETIDSNEGQEGQTEEKHIHEITTANVSVPSTPTEDNLKTADEHKNEMEVKLEDDDFKFCIQTNLTNLATPTAEELSAIALATLSEIKNEVIVESTSQITPVTSGEQAKQAPTMAKEDSVEPMIKTETTAPLEPVIPGGVEVSSQSEFVPISINPTVMSEMDLADAQVEITTDKVINEKKPTNLGMFSMDFLESGHASKATPLKFKKKEVISTKVIPTKSTHTSGTEFTFKAMTKEFDNRPLTCQPKAYALKSELLDILEGNSNSSTNSSGSEQKFKTSFDNYDKQTVVQGMFDFEEAIPSQIVLSNKVNPETVLMDSPKLLERLSMSNDASKAKSKKVVIQSDIKVSEGVPKGLITKLTKPLGTPKPGQKIIIKTTKATAISAPKLASNKPIILSEQIIRPANVLKTVKPAISQPQGIKRQYEDIEDVETAFIIPKIAKKTAVEEEVLVAPEKPLRGRNIKGSGKAKILQQTIITPKGEIIQPKTPTTTTATSGIIQSTQAQSDDTVFDINSMPIVLSDDLLTPESIQNMPVVLSEDMIPHGKPVTVKTEEKIIPTLAKKIVSTVTPKQQIIFKTTPSVAAAPSQAKQTTKPRILSTTPASVKVPKPGTTALLATGTSADGKPTKYVLVPSTVTPTAAQVKPVKPPVVKKPPPVQSKPIVPVAEPPSQIIGNKIMIVTNQHGQQTRVVLTPEQQKAFMQAQPGSKTKAIIKGAIPKALLESAAAGPSGVVQKPPQLSVPQGTTTTVSSQPGGLLMTVGKSVKTPVQPKKSTKSSKPQKTILIKNQMGQTVRKIQGTDDDDLDRQVAEQLEAIKASARLQQANKSPEIINYTNRNIPSSISGTNRTPVRRTFKKVEPLKVKPTVSLPQTSPQTSPDTVMPALAPLSPQSRIPQVQSQHSPDLPKQAPPVKVDPPSSSPVNKPVETVFQQQPPAVSTKPETKTAVAPKAAVPAPVESELKPADRPLTQLVIQDGLGNQTTITEGQILAIPSETVDGQPQSYMLVTLDEMGNITPLNNEALMSLDPSLGLGGDLNNVVLQVDQGQGTVAALKPAEPSVPVASTVEQNKIEERLHPQPPKILQPALEPKPSPVEQPKPQEVPLAVEQQIVIGEGVLPGADAGGQQLIVTGDPIATQKFLESLSDGSTDLANILANAEGGSVLIQADGQQILIKTNTGGQPLLDMAENTEGGGNPIFGTHKPNQDILAAALANTDVFQPSDQPVIHQSPVKGSQLSPGSGGGVLYPMHVGNVLETSLTLNSPIMTPLEVPSIASKKIDDDVDILSQVSKNVDLPITITDPNISQTVAHQQAIGLMELTLPISETTVSTDINSPSYTYSLPTLDESVGHAQKPFNGSMPLLTEDVTEMESSDSSQIGKIRVAKGLHTTEAGFSSNFGSLPLLPETIESSREEVVKTSCFGEIESLPMLNEDVIEDSGSSIGSTKAPRSSSKSLERDIVDEGLSTLGGEMCSSLSEPPPDMFDLASITPKEEEVSSDMSSVPEPDGETLSLHSENSGEIPLQPPIVANLNDLKRPGEDMQEQDEKRPRYD